MSAKSAAKKPASKNSNKKRVYKIVTDDEFDRSKLSASWSQKFGRVFINYDHDNETTGPFIRTTAEDTFTFGFKINYNFDQKFKKKMPDEKCDMDGFTISWPAWSDRDGQSETEEQRRYQEVHKEFVDWLAEWLVEHKTEVGLHKNANKDFVLMTLDGILRYQKDKETKEEDHTKPPIFNAKIASKEVGAPAKKSFKKPEEAPEEEAEEDEDSKEPEEEEEETKKDSKKPKKRKERYIERGIIKDKDGNIIDDPMEFLGKTAKGQLLTHYSGVYINSSKAPYLQVKLYEANLEFMSGGGPGPSLIGTIKRAPPKPLVAPKTSKKDQSDDEDKKSPSKDEDAGSVTASSDVDEDAPPAKSLLPKPVAKAPAKPAPARTIVSAKTAPKIIKKAT